MSTGVNILVVEDELQLRRTIRAMLVSQGYDAWMARTGREALDLLRSEKFDLVLLDINLPDMTGFEVCRAIRSGFNAVVIAVAAHDSEEDTLKAFNAGVDDCVTRPFGAAEVCARIRAHLRRHTTSQMSADGFRFDECVIDFPRRTITRQGERISLSPKQFQLLRYLVGHRGKALSHRRLLQALWGAEYGEETNLLQASVAQLRKKLERDPRAPRYIVTVPWFGYRFTVPSENQTNSCHAE